MPLERPLLKKNRTPRGHALAPGTTRALIGATVVLLLVTATAGCASGPRGEPTGAGEARYPRRAAGCELAIYYTAVPGVVAWDDLGVVEISCHINDAVAECLRRLRTEACGLGGDILYNVPRKPLRPRDQVLVYRAQVAHTRARGAAPGKAEDADQPPPASAEEAAGPVIPLPRAAATEDPAPPEQSSPGELSGGHRPAPPADRGAGQKP